MRRPAQVAGAVLWSLLITLKWLHAQYVQSLADLILDGVLATWEESIRSVIREAFSVATHLLNSASGALLSILSGRSYHHTVRRSSRREATSGAWHSFWATASGTFNALVEREGLGGSSDHPQAADAPRPGAGAQQDRITQQAQQGRPPCGNHREEGAGGGRRGQWWKGGRVREWWRRGGGSCVATERAEHQPSSSAARPPSGKSRDEGRAGKRAAAAGAANGGQRGAAAAAAGAQRAGGGLFQGSSLFELPSGYAISEGLATRPGLVEGAQLWLEVGVTRLFGALKGGLRKALWLEEGRGRGNPAEVVSRRSAERAQQGQRSSRPGRWRRSAFRASGWGAGDEDGRQAVEGLHVWTASDCILRAGYPLEEHSVTTPDGYVLQMHRIPRQGVRDVVFFQHGVLDTSLGWVANGSVGSQAFAAYDAGFDVWLANSRSNAPRLHIDPRRRGSKYWHYSSNELALMDIAAQIDHLHEVKIREILGGRGAGGGATISRPRASFEHYSSLQPPPAAAAPPPAWPTTNGGRAGAPGGREAAGKLSPSLEPPPAAAPPRPPQRSSSSPTLEPLLPQQEHQIGAAAVAVEPAAGPGPGPGAGAGPRPEQGVEGRPPPLGTLSSRPSSIAPAPGQGGGEGRQGEGGAASGGEGEGGTAASIFERFLAAAGSAAAAAGAGWGEGDTQEEGGGPAPEAHATPLAWGPQGAAGSGGPAAAAAAADPFSGEFPLRRSLSAGAVLEGVDAWEGAGTGLPGKKAGKEGWRRRSGSSRRVLRRHSQPPHHAGSVHSMQLADNPAGGGRVGDGGEEDPIPGFPVIPSKPTDPLPSLSPIRTGGGEDGGSMSSGGEGYATPDSEGYDTPWSGYDTPRSGHSMLSGGGREVEITPYRLQAVGHSLGAACVLMYAVGRRMMGQPHRLRRIVLMSPAGMHSHVPLALRPFKYLMPLAVRAYRRLRPGAGVGLRLPSPLLRYLAFKLSRDLHNMPALNDLVRAAMRLLLSGDRSQWDRAMQMPHYNTYSMPALSLHCGAHFAQWSRDPHFRLFDYGSRAANRQHYSSDVPPSISDHYHLLRAVPVDLIAGTADGIINAQDVYRHFQLMREAGVGVTFRQYDYGHMDFTFAVKEEIRRYVLSRLQRPIL